MPHYRRASPQKKSHGTLLCDKVPRHNHQRTIIKEPKGTAQKSLEYFQRMKLGTFESYNNKSQDGTKRSTSSTLLKLKPLDQALPSVVLGDLLSPTQE
ncbi:hypothetical protein PPACK8108_LOCUS17117 [Phakopsora pachyrhizi]|uniref:Uncharacterized protein n=1 Tax=Phakopsora pachyrhizi TaxID=170000 RepID=A0AAV0BB47_PHAPC|nr:hypothetical protein PPACK8108_LOCUS17117 [Phakopsora pachyrhizi]